MFSVAHLTVWLSGLVAGGDQTGLMQTWWLPVRLIGMLILQLLVPGDVVAEVAGVRLGSVGQGAALKAGASPAPLVLVSVLVLGPSLVYFGALCGPCIQNKFVVDMFDNVNLYVHLPVVCLSANRIAYLLTLNV